METAQIIFMPSSGPSKIGVIEVDVLVESEIALKSEVSEYPVEDGFPISDNVTAKPLTLSMVVMVSPLPVTYYDRFAGKIEDRVQSCTEQLLEIYRLREPITLTTHRAIYTDMVMTSCIMPRRKEDGGALKASLDFVQIRKVGVKQTEIPAEFVDALSKGKAGATAANAGTASQTDVGSDKDVNNDNTTKRGSILSSIFKKGGP